MEAKQPAQMMMIFTIGPVQDFIAQARKTRDLWFGSYLLSELSKEAAYRLQERGGELVFPYLHDEIQRESLRVANKILGIVPTNNPKQIALDVRQAVMDYWKGCTKKVMNELGWSINPAMWKRQISDFIEFNAVWSELPNPGDYSAVLRKTENLLAARKTLRDFQQNEPGLQFGEKKSSLDGGRESVLLPARFEDYARFGIKKSETLDAISLVKRLSRYVMDTPAFPSVCDIAFRNFEKEINDNEKLKSAVSSYLADIHTKYRETFKFNFNAYDSRLFFENRIEDFIEENTRKGVRLDEKDRQRVINDISVRLGMLFEKNKRPTSYYAFLLCDGDRMGEHLRKLESIHSHKEFSRHLSQFASEAKRIVEKYDGELVYSGGDDVMAYLPLYSCLRAGDELRKSFAAIMRKAVPSDRQPTLSVGVAVVHMLERLGEVRRLALEAEKLAKKNRDELAIIIHKRNGSDLMKISLPFRSDPVAKLTSIQLVYLKGIFSGKFAYELRDLHDEYQSLVRHSSWMSEEATLRDLLLQEAKRLAFKKKPENVSKQEVEQELIEPIINNAFNSDQAPLEQLRVLAEQAIIAVMLVQEGSFNEKALADSAG